MRAEVVRPEGTGDADGKAMRTLVECIKQVRPDRGLGSLQHGLAKNAVKEQLVKLLKSAYKASVSDHLPIQLCIKLPALASDPAGSDASSAAGSSTGPTPAVMACRHPYAVKEGGIGIQDPEEARLSRCEWVACLLSRAVLGHSMTGRHTIGLATERLHYTLGERRARAPTPTRSGRISKAPVA